MLRRFIQSRMSDFPTPETPSLSCRNKPFSTRAKNTVFEPVFEISFEYLHHLLVRDHGLGYIRREHRCRRLPGKNSQDRIESDCLSGSHFSKRSVEKMLEKVLELSSPLPNFGHDQFPLVPDQAAFPGQTSSSNEW